MPKSSRKRKSSSPKQGSVARELAAIHDWMQEHEKHDDKRFSEGSGKMDKLATKSDLSLVMLDQASKADMAKLTKSLFDEEGKPKFATREDMEPVLNLYKGSTFIKSFFSGATGFIIGLSALGYAIITLIGWLRGTQ